jgi:hypothetical protein
LKAWRIVGSELRGELSRRATEEIARLCDVDEWEGAVEALANPGAAEPAAVPATGRETRF